MSFDLHSSQPKQPNPPQQPDQPAPPKSDAASRSADESFAEVALRLGGASVDESKRTGLIDTADDQVEDLFAAPYKTTNSPVHRAVWDKQVPTELFQTAPTSQLASTSHTASMSQRESVARVVGQSLRIVRKHRDGGTLLDAQGKITAKVLAELGSVGYWGLLVSPEYGGSGATMRQFSEMVTQMATIDPTVAGLASVHGCIGAVDPVRSFGTPDQKKRFLPKLADGRRLSAFALTEPGAGSDLTALRTTAVLDRDHYVVNGEKLFITNAIPGRTIGLVCKIDGKPSVLIVDLPEQESEHFQLKRYGIYALRRANNNGLIFHDFRVPAENLLVPVQGDGLTIAYHGLNLGRVSLCANAAGAMRWMLAEMLPWASYRETYGQTIDRRELVRRRIGRLAGLIVGCDALTAWCAGLLDQGYRGEMECIIAKIFGSEAQKEAAIELFMKTHGGRSFLEGHLFGDHVHEFLAPCIYEGEGEMLGMAFFKSLVKHHGKEFFEPIGRTLSALGTAKPNPLNPRHAWALKAPLARYARWWVGQQARPARWTASPTPDLPVADLPAADRDLARHTRFAQRYLSQSGMRISTTMRTYQLKLTDRQCRMSALSLDIQNAVVVLVTSLYAQASSDPLTRAAADTVCRQLTLQVTGGKASDADFRQATQLGAQIAAQGWRELEGVTAGNIMMPYK